MKTVVILVMFLFTAILSAQTIENFSIDNGGAYSENSGIKILYTIGEVHIQEYAVGNILLSEGFITGNLTSSTLDVEDEDLLDQKINIYPNPASEVINIKSQIPITSIEIFDALGRKIKRTPNTNIDFNNFSTGTYFIKVKTDSGILIKKVIKI